MCCPLEITRKQHRQKTRKESFNLTFIRSPILSNDKLKNTEYRDDVIPTLGWG